MLPSRVHPGRCCCDALLRRARFSRQQLLAEAVLCKNRAAKFACSVYSVTAIAATSAAASAAAAAFPSAKHDKRKGELIAVVPIS